MSNYLLIMTWALACCVACTTSGCGKTASGQFDFCCCACVRGHTKSAAASNLDIVDALFDPYTALTADAVL